MGFLGSSTIKNSPAMQEMQVTVLYCYVVLSPVFLKDYKEGWEPKNWCFQTVVLKKSLESILVCKEIKTVNLKKINPEYSLKGLMLKLQYFGHLMQRANSLEKIWWWEWLREGGEGGDRGWDSWIASLTWVWVNSRRQWRIRKPGVLHSMGLQGVGTTRILNNSKASGSQAFLSVPIDKKAQLLA